MRGDARPVRVVFCWAQASAYMAACWRALAARPGVSVHVLHTAQLFNVQQNRYVNALDGLSNEAFDAHAPGIGDWLVEAVTRQRPDVVVVCGWIYWPYTRVVRSPSLRRVRMVMGMDSPWRGTVTQRLARIRLSATVNRCAAVVTAGERSAEYARRIGFAEHRIRGGYYGFDFSAFSRVAAARTPSAWPRQFIFVGRYVAQKDLSTLVAAYARYRAMVPDPWGLTCSGEGPERARLQGHAGVSDLGFTAPADLPALLQQHGAFVMASSFEPWGVVIGEAAASGLPIVCTSACGAAADLVRPYFNGIVAAPGDVEGLARALRWIHEHEPELAAMGARSRTLAEPFAAEWWAERWHQLLLETLDQDQA